VPRVVRETLVSIRDLAITWGPFIVIGVALLVAAYWLLDPTPPHRVVLATGPENSAYAEFGKRYAEELKRYRIQVELRNTIGSRDNLVLLRDPKQHVDLAFVQGGAAETLRNNDDEHAEPVVSLGSLFYEPVWIFYRAGTLPKFTSLGQLRGKRVNIGARGSGTPGLFMRLLAANQIEPDELQRSLLGETEAVVALLDGKLDAIVLVSAPEAQMVQMLLQTPGVRLFEFTNAEAYARLYRYISPVVLPRGVAHLALDVPNHDLQLIAATTSLVARENIHPAIIELFVQAASRIHSSPGWVARAGQFPSAAQNEFPLANDAERYYRNGPPLLQRYLPFWLANLIDRMWVALFDLAHGAAALPLPRALAHLPLVPQPPTHRARARGPRAHARRAARRPRQARGTRRLDHRAARLRRGALRVAPAHRPRARPASGNGVADRAVRRQIRFGSRIRSLTHFASDNTAFFRR
jgi:TRAP transporter TAXI family solute receptor